MVKKHLYLSALCYGTYAILCQLCGIMLFFRINLARLPHALLSARCAKMLEYPLMSLTALLIGALLIYYVTEKQDTESES